MLTRRIVQRWLGYGDVIIKVYHVYQIRKTVYVRGRVLREDNVIARATDGWLKNFIKMLKRLMSDESPHVELNIEIAETITKIKADSEGFFEADIHIDNSQPTTCTLHVDPRQLTTRQSSEVVLSLSILPFSASANYGIISDIDDTILVTGVVSRFKWRLILNTLFVNPYKRKSFPKTAHLFNRLAEMDNPVFYISNSPWNMYEYLSEYLRLQAFPSGILLLRDINFLQRKSKVLEKQSKYREIMQTMNAHDELPFILIGDAGEVDVDIYLRIADRFPNRIKAIYIRAVKDNKRMNRVRTVIFSVSGVDVLLFDHSNEVKMHAEKLGLISPED